MQGDDVLLEVQCAVFVGVKGAENVLGVRVGVAFWEELAVDGLELLFADAACRTLPLEVFVPLDNLHLCEFGVELQVLQDLLGHSTAL